MKIYDISQQLPNCQVYPGDPRPEIRRSSSIEKGDLYNLTEVSMCAHNGTHVDAPFHFINTGNSIENVPLSKTVGFAYVAVHEGDITASEAENIICKAEKTSTDAAKKILIKGNAILSEEGARVFAERGIDLIGSEFQSVGPSSAPMAVHKILLKKEIVLLEGIRLANVPEGVHFLCAAPLSIVGSDGAPCRAILVDFG